MTGYEVKNASIEYTHLGVPSSDHGILSFTIGLNYGGSGQGYGQLCLDTYDEVKKRRVPTALVGSLLLGINEVFGLDWEELKGTPCRAYATRGNIRAIGHYLKDKWLWLNESTIEFEVTPLTAISQEDKP